MNKKQLKKEKDSLPLIGGLLKVNLRGRPRIYKDEEAPEFINKIEEYFDFCAKMFRMPNKAGLVLWLGMTRETYNQYKDKKDFSDAIKVAEHLMEDSWVQKLGGDARPAGAIFYLKNAFHDHFKDKQETDITSGGEKIENPLGVDIEKLAIKMSKELRKKV